MNTTALRQEVLLGKVDLDTAMEKFTMTAKHIGDGGLEDMAVPTLHSGFYSLDDFSVLKETGELIIVGALPGMGKSSLMLQMALAQAKKGNSLFISMEMSYTALKRRLMSMVSEIPLANIKENRVPKERLLQAAERLANTGLFVEDCDRLNINELINKVITLNHLYPLNVVVIDYYQIIEASVARQRWQELTDIAQALKDLSKQIKKPIVLGAQVKAEVASNGRRQATISKRPGDYRPTQNDIAECSAATRIADVIVMLSRQEAIDGTRPNIADVGVVKNRDGKTGWTELEWYGALTKFKEKPYL